jgi:ribonuclease HI
VTPVTVDIYCDASVVGLSSAWGAVIVRPDEAPLEASGRFLTEGLDSTRAELRAAANAIHAALKAGLIKPGDRVVIRCDNSTAAALVAGEKVKRDALYPDRIEVLAWIAATASNRGFEVTAKWVRGHQRADAADRHVIHNRRADHLCARVLVTRKVRRSRARLNKSRRAHKKAKDELDRLARMVDEADQRDGDPDLEGEPDMEDGQDDYVQALDPWGCHAKATWNDDEDFEESGPADRWGEEGQFGHEDDEESAIGWRWEGA